MEYDRVCKLTDQRLLFADTAIKTTHFMKRCVIVDKDEDKRSSASNPFKRGIMGFEDFNYSMFNPYVLVED